METISNEDMEEVRHINDALEKAQEDHRRLVERLHIKYNIDKNLDHLRLDGRIIRGPKPEPPHPNKP